MKFFLLCFVLIIHLTLLIHLEFTAWPEMLSFPYLFSNGFSLYSDFAHPYTPLLTLLLTLVYSVFGLTVNVLQIFTWIWILTTDILIFVISRLLFMNQNGFQKGLSVAATLRSNLFNNRLIFFLPLILYVFLQPILDGNMLWLDLGITPPLLAGVYFALRWIREDRKLDVLLWGLSWSVAIFIKQQAGLLFIPAVLFILLIKKMNFLPSISFLIVGSSIPAFFVFFWLIINNNLRDFIFWTLEFPIIWLPKIPGYSDLPTMRELVVPLLIFVPGFILGLLSRKKEVIFLMIVCSICIMMSFPRFSYFHLQPALAVYVLILSLGFLKIPKKYNFLRLLIFLSIFGGFILWNRIIPLAWDKAPRFYGPEEIDLGQRMKDLVGTEDKIYMIGSYSSVYVYANRLPPKPWYDNFVWYFEIPGIQEKQIEGLEKIRPKYILRQLPEPGQWYELGTYQPQKIVEYLKLNYNLEGEFSRNIEQWKIKD